MRRLRDQRGVTLVELMIVVVVFGILVGGMYNTFMAQDRAYEVQNDLAEMNQNARVALRIMSQEIRGAGYDPTRIFSSAGAGAGFRTATATSVVFTRDINEDGDVTTAPNDDMEWLGYLFDAANNQIDLCWGQTACGAWEDFVDDVEDLQFRYIYVGDTPGAPLNSDTIGMPNDGDADDRNDMDNVREVEIRVVARMSSAVSELRPRTLTSRVQIRNLGIR